MKLLKTKRAGIVVLALGVMSLLVIPAIRKHAQVVKERAEQEQIRAAEAAVKAKKQEELDEEQRQKQRVEDRRNALAAVHFETDPKNELPVMSLGDLTARIYDRRNPLTLEKGQRVRIDATLDKDNINSDGLRFMLSPTSFLYQNYEFRDFVEKDIQSLRPGEEVEFIGDFQYETDDSVPGHYASSTMNFFGVEIQRVYPD
jgi:hypothetical protein